METTLKNALDAAGLETSTLATFWEGYAGTIYTLTVPGAEAIARWRTLRALVPQTGHWPVLLGDDRDLATHASNLKYVGSVKIGEALQQAGGLDAGRLIQKWASNPERPQSDPDADEDDWDNAHAYWMEGEQALHEFTIPVNHRTKAPKPEIAIGLVPTTRGWEVPALLGFGGCNECPPPAEHACLLKHWHEIYGAEVVGVTLDTIEMQVARPPETKDAALSLAREQYAYCPDVVEQGTRKVGNLASILFEGSVWYFWWD